MTENTLAAEQHAEWHRRARELAEFQTRECGCGLDPENYNENCQRCSPLFTAMKQVEQTLRDMDEWHDPIDQPSYTPGPHGWRPGMTDEEWQAVHRRGGRAT